MKKNPRQRFDTYLKSKEYINLYKKYYPSGRIAAISIGYKDYDWLNSHVTNEDGTISAPALVLDVDVRNIKKKYGFKIIKINNMGV